VNGPETVVRVTVKGRVQGVGFRAFTQEEALARGIVGWVRNRRNGDVEAVFAGSFEAVEELCAICRRGPPSARVQALDVQTSDRTALSEAGWTGGFQQLGTL
jgi:acylphosphatase